MSFLTEYFDEYRQHPIRKTMMCRPENRWAKLEGKWLDPKVGTQDKAWTEEEIEAFIKATMKSLRGQSTYYNDYCAYLSQAMIESSYSTHQPLTHMQKDLKLALGLGDALEQSLPLSATTNEIFKHAKRLGYANHDVAAVYIRARF